MRPTESQHAAMGSEPWGPGRTRHRAPAGGRDLRTLREAENFPVALRVLPARLRADLVAVYDVARVIDDLGDEAEGDRTALLTAFAADLEKVWSTGEPTEPVLRRLVPTARRCDLEREPFDRLVRANLQDQAVTSYDTFDDLREYCTLSADPVGRIVLRIFGVRSERADELSDRVCTGLQVLEHLQDVAEDRRAGRVYLPRDDMDRFDVTESDLDAATTGDPLRSLLEFETGRALNLLGAGRELLGLLPRGWARIAVAGFVGGGRGAADSLIRARFDVLGGKPRVRRRDVARRLAGELIGRGGR